VEIATPALADRKEDLIPLERHFVSRFARQYGKEVRGLTRRAQIRLSTHNWPGNVRELENVIGHAAMMTVSDMIDVLDLPPYLQSAAEQAQQSSLSLPSAEVGTLEEQERLLIIRALESANGNQSKAARILRIGRDALRYKLKKYDLEQHHAPESADAS
jgi:DNA-binding NtrC family response regulator